MAEYFNLLNAQLQHIWRNCLISCSKRDTSHKVVCHAVKISIGSRLDMLCVYRTKLPLQSVTIINVSDVPHKFFFDWNRRRRQSMSTIYLAAFGSGVTIGGIV